MDTAIFISYLDPKFAHRYKTIIKEDSEYLLKLLHEKSNQGNEIFKSWAISRGCSVVQLGDGVGVISMYPAYLNELSSKWKEYDGLVDTCLNIGVGKTLQEAEIALEKVKHDKGSIKFFSPALAHENQKEESSKSIGEIVSKELMAKAEDSEPDLNELLGHLHTHTKNNEQSIKNDQQKNDLVEDSQNKNIKNKVVQSLQILKQNLPVIKEIQIQSPDLYQAILNLSQVVISVAEKLSNKEKEVSSKPSISSKEQSETPKNKHLQNKEGKVRVYHPKTHRTSWRKIGSKGIQEKDPENVQVVG